MNRIKSTAKARGVMLAEEVKKFRFHQWRNGVWEQVQELNSKKPANKYRADRVQYDRECKIMSDDRFIAYVAWITAPNNVEREIVVDYCFLQKRTHLKNARRAMGVITDKAGYRPNVSPDKKIADYEAFKFEFETISKEIEKILIAHGR